MTAPNNLRSPVSIMAGIARRLGSAENLPELLELIVEEAMSLTNADGGSLYLVKENQLHFEIVRNNTLNIDFGGSRSTPIPESFRPIALSQSSSHVCVHVITSEENANIADVYCQEAFDFSGTREMDRRTGYRSQSFLTVGLFDHHNHPVGVLQLINATDPATNEVIAFTATQQEMVEGFAGMAAVSINNASLRDEITNLFEAFMKLIASAIDEKSPYTGGHCRRVPDLVMDLANCVHKTDTGPFANVFFNDDDMYELHVASWLHDIGKICIPEYVVDKATKLETIYDRIHEVEMRFEVLKRDAEIRKYKSILSGKDEAEAEQLYQEQLNQLDEDLAFLKVCNVGSEYLADEKISRLNAIAQTPITLNGSLQSVLTDDYLNNLSIRAGTLTFDERERIRDHIKVTIQMLEQLPFPKHLVRVPEFAGGHHETMIGTGYPKGLFKDDMSVQARMMAIADIFEALTASDRPYKDAKSLSEAMRIMGIFKRKNHIDPDLFDEFIRSKVYLRYAEEYMEAHLIDEIDEAALLAIHPDNP